MNEKIFGLIGKNIDYSFSKKYFDKKKKKKLLKNISYKIFNINNIKYLKNILKENPNIKGLNVTIPYKEKIIPILDEISKEAKEIGAVNTVKIVKKKIIGYNTDAFGFKKSFVKKLNYNHKKALILGTGGASKAISYILDKLNIPYIYISRKKNKKCLSYEDINKNLILNYNIIINCTPLGTYPKKTSPKIPYHFLSKKNYLFDLVYNPNLTIFLKKGNKYKCTIQNGLNMLHYQADKSWEIWGII